jgi:hypothetical protein
VQVEALRLRGEFAVCEHRIEQGALLLRQLLVAAGQSFEIGLCYGRLPFERTAAAVTLAFGADAMPILEAEPTRKPRAVGGVRAIARLGRPNARYTAPRAILCPHLMSVRRPGRARTGQTCSSVTLSG